MAKDEDVYLHCGLCAERCPTAAWDMQQFWYNVTKAGEVKYGSMVQITRNAQLTLGICSSSGTTSPRPAKYSTGRWCRSRGMPN
jgi:ferredoxin